MSLDPWRVLDRRVLHDSVLRIEEHDVEAGNGDRFTFPVLYQRGYVKVLPVLPSGDVVLVRQYRHALGRVTLELPAGGLEPGEDHEVAARRELSEEAFVRCDALEHLGSFVSSPGRSDEVGHLFLGRNCEPDPDARPAEPTEPVVLPFAVARALVGHEIVDAGSTIAFLLAEPLLEAS